MPIMPSCNYNMAVICVPQAHVKHVNMLLLGTSTGCLTTYASIIDPVIMLVRCHVHICQHRLPSPIHPEQRKTESAYA